MIPSLQSAEVVRILMVEDNQADILLSTEALALARVVCEIETAENGLDAQRRLQGGYLPSLILLDLNMPVMDGREFLGWLKGDPTFRSIPVVVLTTSDDDLDVNDAWRRQCAAYIRKPVTLERLADAFQRMSEFYFVIVELPRPS